MKERLMTLTHGGVTLRAITHEDEAEMLTLLTSDAVAKTFMLPVYSSREEALPLCRRLCDMSADPAKFVYGIFTSHLVGLLNEVEITGDSIELGYAIIPREWGNGYATDALSAATGELFRMGYTAVRAGAFEGNDASMRVMEKSGMRRTRMTASVEYRGKTHPCIYYEIKAPSLTIRNRTADEDLTAIRTLYEDAFPECERKPFDVMVSAIGRGLDMCAIEEGGSFVGLAITLVYGDVALLDYFAVASHRRGCGIGAAALDLLKKKYSGRSLLIEIEDPDDECDNPEIRRRRLSFYKRCGMNIMPYKVYFYGTKMLTLTSGGCVDYPSHVAVYENVLGDEVAKNIVLCDE